LDGQGPWPKGLAAFEDFLGLGGGGGGPVWLHHVLFCTYIGNPLTLLNRLSPGVAKKKKKKKWYQYFQPYFLLGYFSGFAW